MTGVQTCALPIFVFNKIFVCKKSIHYFLRFGWPPNLPFLFYLQLLDSLDVVCSDMNDPIDNISDAERKKITEVVAEELSSVKIPKDHIKMRAPIIRPEQDIICQMLWRCGWRSAMIWARQPHLAPNCLIITDTKSEGKAWLKPIIFVYEH